MLKLSLFIGLTVGLFGCHLSKNNRGHDTIKSNVLNLENVYYQKIIPGQRESNPYYKLSFGFEDEVLKIDSVLMYASKLKLNIRGNNDKYISLITPEMFKGDHSLLIYSHSPDGVFSYHLENIREKEPLAMP